MQQQLIYILEMYEEHRRQNQTEIYMIQTHIAYLNTLKQTLL